MAISSPVFLAQSICLRITIDICLLLRHRCSSKFHHYTVHEFALRLQVDWAPSDTPTPDNNVNAWQVEAVEAEEA
jgi:hypothetical protein